MFLLSVVRHTSKVLQAYNLPWKQHNFCSLGTFFCCNRSIILQFSICSFWEPVWSPNHESKWSGNLFYLILYLRARQINRCLTYLFLDQYVLRISNYCKRLSRNSFCSVQLSDFSMLIWFPLYCNGIESFYLKNMKSPTISIFVWITWR